MGLKWMLQTYTIVNSQFIQQQLKTQNSAPFRDAIDIKLDHIEFRLTYKTIYH